MDADAGPALVRVEQVGGVSRVTLDSPHNRNALSHRLISELVAALDASAADPDVRVVVLGAAGRAFCSGADLTEMRRDEGPARGTSDLLMAMRRILTLPQPVLARVQGPARAGGLGLLGACDIVLAAGSATFAFSEVRIGVAPAVISLTTLPRMAPRQAAAAFLGGDVLDAASAQACGLVTAAVADAELDAAVDSAVASVLAGSPQGVAASKRLLAGPVLAGLDAGGEAMAELSARLFASPEAGEGMAAFLERRPPRWAATGRPPSPR